MRNYVRGTFEASAATLSIVLGFQPDKVVISNLIDRTSLIWYDRAIGSLTDDARYGISIAAAGTRGAVAAAAYGIVKYNGTTELAAASTSILTRKDKDQKAVDVAAGNEVTSWTLGSAANYTGNFNCDVTGATIGPGSKIVIDGVVYDIITLTAGQGVAANEVGLLTGHPQGAPASGTVDSISSRLDFADGAIGEIPGEGITIGASATVNDTDGDLCLVEAWGL